MKRVTQFRNMDHEELVEQLDILQTELFNLRIKNTTKELQDTNRIRQARRDIARVRTLLAQRAAAGEAAADRS